MEISRQKSGDLLILRLKGRLDANWCNHVQDALASAVRAGEHRVHLDMAEVVYLSSAGLRVLLMYYKQLRAISGLFAVANPSAFVKSVLDLSGLSALIASGGASATASEEKTESKSTASAGWKIHAAGTSSSVPMRLTVTGNAAVLAGGISAPSGGVQTFGDGVVALGVGSLGTGESDHASRAGEMLALAGVAAFQPADGTSSRPDFMVSEGSLVPQGRLLLGITAEGTLGSLMRFEATDEARTIGLTELAATALEHSGGMAAVVVGIAETAGLVGASLRQSPAAPLADQSAASAQAAGLGTRFSFPQIRDWLSFTSERAFRDSTSIFVGIVARPGSALDPLLRPMAEGSGLMGHFHAAAFPYRPLRKGRIELKPLVAELFEGQPPQAILHLLADSRGITGAGESEFFRGALWVAPAVIS